MDKWNLNASTAELSILSSHHGRSIAVTLTGLWQLRNEDQLEAEAEAFPACLLAPAHHWLLASPAGPDVTGTCKHCGEVRLFSSAGPDTFLDGLSLHRDPVWLRPTQNYNY